MKCFVGLPCSPSAVAPLLELQKQALDLDPKARIVSQDNFHITLAFIGELAEEKARVLSCSLERLTDFTGEQWQIDRCGLFVRPKVFWAAGDKSRILTQLREEVRSLLMDREIPFDDGHFRPHITLLRKSCLESLIVKAPFAWPILRAQLFESKQDEQGRRVYVPI